MRKCLNLALLSLLATMVSHLPAPAATPASAQQPSAEQKAAAEKLKQQVEAKARTAVKADHVSSGSPARTTQAAGSNRPKFSIKGVKSYLPKARAFAEACAATNEALAGGQENLANLMFWDGAGQARLRSEARFWRDEARKWRENYGTIERIVNALTPGSYYTINIVWGNGPQDRYSVTGEATP
jgi:hypothetical protein